MSLVIAVKAVQSCVSVGKAVQNQRIQSKIMTNLDDFSGKLDQIDAKVDLVTQKTDALIIRDLLSANLALDDIKAVGVWDSAELLQLENMYRVNTGLPLEGETCGIRNSQIRVMSYFGLFQIGILKGLDDKRLVRYVLHMFETGEKIVWEELFPQFYEAVFATTIEEAQKKRKKRLQFFSQWKGDDCDPLGAFVIDSIQFVTELGSIGAEKKAIMQKAKGLLENGVM